MKSSAALLSFLLCCQCSIALSQDVVLKNVEHETKTNNDIAFSLVFQNSLFAPIREQEKPLPLFVPYLVVWKDGRCLCGKITENNKRPTEFYFGKIDREKCRQIEKLVLNAFPVKSNATLVNYGPDAGYYRLWSNWQGENFTLKTWEQFKNAKSLPDHEVLSISETRNGQPLLLPEFYEKWQTHKKQLFDFCNSIVCDKELQQVYLETTASDTLIICDKNKAIIATASLISTQALKSRNETSKTETKQTNE